MDYKLPLNKHGFTLVELIAVVAIVSILTLLMVVNLKGRGDDSKKQAAQAEMRSMSESEKQVEALYGYYVPISILSDVPIPPLNATSFYDTIGYHTAVFVIDPKTGYDTLSPSSGFRTVRDILSVSPTLNADSINTNLWKGPFLSYHYSIQTNYNFLNYTLPLDPWKNYYRLLNPDGREIQLDGTIDISQTYNMATISQGRFAIVSYGKDGLKDTQDDIYYPFN